MGVARGQGENIRPMTNEVKQLRNMVLEQRSRILELAQKITDVEMRLDEAIRGHVEPVNLTVEQYNMDDMLIEQLTPGNIGY